MDIAYLSAPLQSILSYLNKQGILDAWWYGLDKDSILNSIDIYMPPAPAPVVLVVGFILIILRPLLLADPSYQFDLTMSDVEKINEIL